MRKLLSANNRAILKSKIFWMEVIFCVLFSVWIIFANYSPEIQMTEHRLSLDDSFFNMYQIMSLMLASAISLIVGTEYSDGTIRNKLVVGHTRCNIYFSTLLTNLCVTAVMLTIHGIVSYVLGYILFGAFQMNMAQLALCMMCALLCNFVFTTLFVAIAMNCSNKALTAVSSLVLSIVIMFASGFVSARLSAPEMTYDGIITTENGLMLGDTISNPLYVSGTTRTLYEFFYDLLPTGQLMQIQAEELMRCNRWPILSISLFLVITVVGYLFFYKKDIK